MISRLSTSIFKIHPGPPSISNTFIRYFPRAATSISSSYQENKNAFKKYLSSEAKPTPPTAATIMQGPSLLTGTGIYRPSPTLFHLPGMRSLPFWTSNVANNDKKLSVAYNDPTITSILNHLESNVEIIQAEYRSSQSKNLPSDYDIKDEHASGALHTGQWEWRSYILNGKPQTQFETAYPQTTKIIHGIEDHLFTTPFSFCFFSELKNQSSIKSHCGPMNLRLRIHLTLFGGGVDVDCGIRVANQYRKFIPGKAIVIDDSYEHEVWNFTDDDRVTLLVDIWHPDVLKEERRRIENMFEYAKDQGWIGNQKDK